MAGLLTSAIRAWSASRAEHSFSKRASRLARRSNMPATSSALMARHCAQVYEQKRTGYQCPVRVAVRSARCGPAALCGRCAPAGILGGAAVLIGGTIKNKSCSSTRATMELPKSAGTHTTQKEDVTAARASARHGRQLLVTLAHAASRTASLRSRQTQRGGTSHLRLWQWQCQWQCQYR